MDVKNIVYHNLPKTTVYHTGVTDLQEYSRTIMYMEYSTELLHWTE